MDADDSTADYMSNLSHIIRTVEKSYNLICMCHHCDRLEFVSLLYEDAIDMPIWFAEELARRS